MRRCTVFMTGTDGQRHSIETDALSLFDAAYNAQQQWARLSWFDPQALIEVRAGNGLFGACGRTASGVGLTGVAAGTAGNIELV